LPGPLRGSRWVWFVTIACGSVVAVLPLVGVVRPWLQYAARVQGLYVPLILGGLAALDRYAIWPASANRTKCHAQLWRLTAWTCAVTVFFHCGATNQWNRYRAVIVQELAEHRGLIAFERSAAPSYEFNWGWTMPSLSIALSALNLGSVSAIIENPDSPRWQPIDPENPATLPDLRPYGVPTVLD
jgi:hypothetical protein